MNVILSLEISTRTYTDIYKYWNYLLMLSEKNDDDDDNDAGIKDSNTYRVAQKK